MPVQFEITTASGRGLYSSADDGRARRFAWGMAAMTLKSLVDDPRLTVRRAGPPDPEGRCVIYWMQRAQRAVDNPALDVAVASGNDLGVPVVVFLGLVPFHPGANLRSLRFLVEGLADIEAGLHGRNVGFVLRRFPEHHLLRFVEETRPSLIVGDENPLREPERWRQIVASRLRVPLWTVEADAVVPPRLIGREHYAARTIRPHLQRMVDRFLVTEPDRAARHAWVRPRRVSTMPASLELLEGFPTDRSVSQVPELRGGTTEGRKALSRFIRGGLRGYSTSRNHPDRAGTSRLSPYLHFGHLGPRMVACAVRDAGAPLADRQAFLEQLIVRRELAINYVRYNPAYDRLAGCEPWALATLARHARDERRSTYSERQLEEAATHDPLWNAAQREMVETGWMHGYVRMYWAKKILEWSRTPEEAFEIAVRLNDRYELDGRDPNGYAGIAWAIGGKHDRAWGPERPIYGTVRYMSLQSTSRKFDSKAYIARNER